MKPRDWTAGHARHLLWRAGFGGPPSQVAYLARLSPEEAVAALVDFDATPEHEPVRATTFEEWIMREPTAEERRELMQARRAGNEDVLARARLNREERERADRAQIKRMQRWWLERMIETPRPLEEKLTLFWHGHFATSYRTIENSYHMFLQNQLLRRHAAGNFGDLLFGIIRDPAMLAYLDNNDSRAERPNENLARELMELFSLGQGHYAERDIKEGARALTGYTFEGNAFVFRRDWHDGGMKNLLGAAGPLDGDGFVRAILEKKRTAEFIAGKLYRFFVSDAGDADPERGPAARAVIRGLASTLLAGRYELKPVLRRLFLSEHFYDASNRFAHIKSPAELIVGAARSLGAPVRDLGIVCDAMDLMGQNIFFPPSVKGWDGGRSWINTSTLYIRANIMNFLLTGRMPHGHDALAETQRLDPLPLVIGASEEEAHAEKDPQKLAAFLMRFCFGFEPGKDKLAAVAELMRARGGTTPEAITAALSVIAAAPEYQLC
ncbi:MAG: DUF1800 domain-containing protein [Planctomycetota bacterium]|nr:DUF1800 domain-containing protein [Planctomycetota bacterium]